MNFQQMVDLFAQTRELDRSMVHTRLEGLIKEQLIKEENKGKRRKGQSRWFNITAKGERRILNESAAVAAESLKKVRDLTARLAQQDPEKLDDLRRFLWKTKETEEYLEKLKKASMLPEEYARRFEERTKDNPLLESLKAIYDIFLRVNLSPHERPKEGFAIAFTKEGLPYLITVRQLKKHGLGTGL